MSAFERRLTRLEQELLPLPAQPFCLLVEPQSDATPEAWEDHRQQIDEAKARGDFVGIVLVDGTTGKPHSAKGIEYFASEFEATLSKLARSPSERGNDSLLVDVLKDAMGNVVGPRA